MTPINWNNIANSVGSLATNAVNTVNSIWNKPVQQPIEPRTYTSQDYEHMLQKELLANGYSPQQAAFAMAQVKAESGFNPVNENRFSYQNLIDIRDNTKRNKARKLIYSGYKSAREALRKLTPQQIQALAEGDDQQYFNFLYGSRKDLGNGIDSNDGYNFRGRGLIQITGRDAYSRLSKDLGYDYLADPDALNSPEHAAKATVAFLNSKKFKEKALNSDLATLLVHGSNKNHTTNQERAKLAQQYYAMLLGNK